MSKNTSSRNLWQRWRVTLIVAALVAPLLSAVVNVAPASAAEEAAEALATVPSSPAASLDLDPAAEGAAVVATDDSGTVTLPEDPADGVAIQTSEGIGIKLTLPGAGEAQDAVVEGAQAVYTGGLADAAVAVRAEETGVQALGVLSGGAAANQYEFGLTVETGPSQLVARDDGGIDLIKEGEGTIASVEPAWARDADGKPVPTSYAVTGDGKTIVQTVQHQGGEVVYPVVFDPRITFGWWMYVRYSKSEVRDFASRSPYYAVGAIGAYACSRIKFKPGAAACAFSFLIYANALVDTFNRARSENKCVEIRIDYLGDQNIGGWKRYSC